MSNAPTMRSSKSKKRRSKQHRREAYLNWLSGAPETKLCKRQEPSFLTRFRAFCETPTGQLSFVVSIYAIVALSFWDGIGPRDAERYIAAAFSWSENGPALGENHWALRYLLVLPMAFIFSVFGESQFAACAPNIIYGALLVAISFLFGRRLFGAIEGVILGAFIAVSAFFSIQAGELRIYGVEIFFVALSLWLFADSAAKENARVRGFFAAGLAAGGAWLCRETTIFLPLALVSAPAFFGKYNLKAAISGALGFAAVIVIEILAYLAVTGDAFYRYKIDLDHGGGNPNTTIGGPAENETIGFYLIQPFMELLSYPTVTPFFLIGAAALCYCLTRAKLTTTAHRVLIFFSAAALLSFLVAGYPLNLEYAGYYPLMCYAAFLAIAVAAAHLFRSKKNYCRHFPGCCGCLDKFRRGGFSRL